MASLLHSTLRESPDLFHVEWGKAQPTVHALLHQQHVPIREWHDLFQIVFNITAWLPRGQDLIKTELLKEIKEYVCAAKKRIHAVSDDNSRLRVYINEWNLFAKQADILPLPFKERDTSDRRSSLRTNEDSINEVRKGMFEEWNKVVFHDISDMLLSASMALLLQERLGEKIDSNRIIGIRQSFVSLTEAEGLALYRSMFEKRYVDDTRAFYRTRAADYLTANGVLSYMEFADKSLLEEENRALKYLHSTPESMTMLVDNCVLVLVVSFQDQIVGECPKLIERNDIDKLRMLYRLIKRTPKGLDAIVEMIDEHIRSEGLNDMRASTDTITSDPERYVTLLLQMYDRFSKLVSEGFYDEPQLLTARDKAFRAVVNDTSVFKLELQPSVGYPTGVAKKNRSVAVESKCPELLANYCDLLLRKSPFSKKLSSDEIDQKLAHLLLVLKYVENKDVFMRFHKAHLSRRLILDMSADQEKEEQLVTKLREAGMPVDHVNKLSRMLQDIELNKDLNVTFKKTLVGTNNNRMYSDLINIKILNGGAWGRGLNEKIHVSLPRELEDFVPEVECFYKKQHSGRKLQWMHHWSNGTIVFGTNNGGHYDVDVTTFQMAVLFTWNDRPKDRISFETLRLSTELPENELSRTLFSLVAFPRMKSQIVMCDAPEPINARNFNDSTLFWLNHDFHLVKNGKVQQRGRLNLIGRLQLYVESTTSKDHDEILALRQLRVQEAIVKIMKTRKSLSNARLQTELVEMLKNMFIPNRKLIKEQIDWLIERGYMERSPDDMNTFIYLA